MRTFLRLAALFLALVIVVFWFFAGHNLGFSKTSVTHFVKDPVTDIEQPVIEDRFVPGVDFLGGGLVLAAVLAGTSFFFRLKDSAKPA